MQFQKVISWILDISNVMTDKPNVVKLIPYSNKQSNYLQKVYTM